MAVTGSPRAGKNSYFQASGLRMTLQTWTVQDQVEDLDGTNFQSDGFLEHVAGCLGCDVTAAGNWNAANTPFTDPPALFPGTFLTNTYCGVNTTDDTAYVFPSFFVVSVQTAVDVHQTVKINISGKSDGIYFEPGEFD